MRGGEEPGPRYDEHGGGLLSGLCGLGEAGGEVDGQRMGVLRGLV